MTRLLKRTHHCLGEHGGFQFFEALVKARSQPEPVLLGHRQRNGFHLAPVLLRRFGGGLARLCGLHPSQRDGLSRCRLDCSAGTRLHSRPFIGQSDSERKQAPQRICRVMHLRAIP